MRPALDFAAAEVGWENRGMRGTCEQCGQALGEHDREVRFRLPDVVAELPEDERAARTRPSDDPLEAVMMVVDDVDAFVRCLVAIRLSGGHELGFGVWVSTTLDALRHAARCWHEPEYADLTIDGKLANTLPVWGLLDAPVRATVVDPHEVPHITSSDDAEMATVLAGEWAHELVLPALP